jgi:hypothetical protein
MNQSDVAGCIYTSLFAELKTLGGDGSVFTVSECASGAADFTVPLVVLSVTDICQTAVDKSGQRIVVDEKLYETPAQFMMGICCSVYGTAYAAVLNVLGEIAVCFKDNPSLDVSACNWHGNECRKVFVEPEIRQLEQSRFGGRDGVHVLSLFFRIDFNINSRIGTGFKRVEKRDLHSNVLKK